ncbi:MAG: hypothetical protein DMF88_18985 [Acidobacteria bacterium]|nr:MAG: hypothetical protein DMF88_18985 [Acidobacteriota bacterium]
MRSRLAPWIVVLLMAAPAAAQQAKPSVLAIDSSASVDFTTDGDGNDVKGVFLDTLVVGDFGRHVQAIVRPQVQRLANSGEWNRQIWVAEMRYERPGPVAFRIEGGYIPSPVGLANLTLRPHMNPTIAQPAELFTSIPSLEVRGPRVNLLSGIYPLGAQATASARHWDARAAVIDTSPLRLRRVFGDPNPPLFGGNPPRFTNVVIGAGVTPFVGFRVGAALTHGGWLRAGESPAITIDRSANLVNVEMELSFRHTSLASEVSYDALDTSLGTRSTSGWYVQGAQTLAPRWFVAGRVERIQTTLPTVAGLEQNFTGTEQTLGFRLTPEITLRASHRMRQQFGRDPWDHFGAVSIVWYRRWM